MKRLILASIALASSQVFAGDWVYAYGNSGNVGYDCTVYHVYFDTEGYATLFADRCRVVSRDTGIWPVFPPHEVYLSLDFPYGSRGFPARIVRSCQLVAHAKRNGTTSTVVDCRQANAAATAR